MKLPDLEGMLKHVSKIKLRGGVVGKVAVSVIVVSLALATISWSAHNVWISLLALLLVFGLAFPLLWRLISFADRNPQAALLEGAEFLVHAQMTLGTKTQPAITVEATDRLQPAPIDVSPRSLENALKPDALPALPKLPGQGGG